MKAYLVPAALGSALALSTAMAAVVVTVTFNGNTAPSGAQIANNSLQPGCTVTGESISCNAYQISGVGNTNAALVLSATYEGTVQCQNNGGKIVDVKTQTTSTITGPSLTELKNGKLSVSAVGTSPPSSGSFLASATCPNGNWDKIPLGTPTLETFTYTLTFIGFGSAPTNSVVVITGP